MHLVFFALQPLEEPANAGVLHLVAVLVGHLAAGAVHDKRALLVGEFAPRHIEPHAGLFGATFQIHQAPAVVGFGPRFDGAARHTFVRVRHDEVEVQFNHVAKTVARRTRTKRVVEREQTWLRQFIRNATRPALKPFREPVHRTGLPCRVHLHGKRRAVTLVKRRLDGFGEAAAHAWLDLQPIHDHRKRRFFAEGLRVHVLKRDHHVVDHHAAETTFPQTSQRGRERVFRSRLHHRRQIGLNFPVTVCVGTHGAEVTGKQRQVKPHQQAGAFGQVQQGAGDHVRALTLHLAATLPADGAPRTRPEQPQVVVDFCRGPHRGPGVPDGVFLPDGDRGGDALDGVHVRLFHPLQKLAGIGRERLHVPALAFGVDGVKGQRGLARTGDPGKHHQLAVRQGQIDPFQVVGPCPFDHQLPCRAGRRDRCGIIHGRPSLRSYRIGCICDPRPPLLSSDRSPIPRFFRLASPRQPPI